MDGWMDSYLRHECNFKSEICSLTPLIVFHSFKMASLSHVSIQPLPDSQCGNLSEWDGAHTKVNEIFNFTQETDEHSFMLLLELLIL